MSEKENLKNESYEGIPVCREVYNDMGASTPSKVLRFINSLRHPDGAINPEADSIREIMKSAEGKDLDVILVPKAMNILTISGKWIADHPEYIKIGVGIVLTTTLVAGATAFIIRKHSR